MSEFVIGFNWKISHIQAKNLIRWQTLVLFNFLGCVKCKVHNFKGFTGSSLSDIVRNVCKTAVKSKDMQVSVEDLRDLSLEYLNNVK